MKTFSPAAHPAEHYAWALLEDCGRFLLIVLMFLFGCALAGIAQESPAHISPPLVQDLQGKSSGFFLIDARPASKFSEAHIPGAVNVPLSDLERSTIPANDLILVYCGGIGCPTSDKAAAQLKALGHQNIRVLEGGLAAWKQRGYPLAQKNPAGKISSISPKTLNLSLSKTARVIIDIRPPEEYLSGRIPGSHNIPLEKLDQALDAFPKGNEPIVYGRLSKRVDQAASMISKKGLPVKKLVGGIAVWAKYKPLKG